jgi:hypothetical protein
MFSLSHTHQIAHTQASQAYINLIQIFGTFNCKVLPDWLGIWGRVKLVGDGLWSSMQFLSGDDGTNAPGIPGVQPDLALIATFR